MHTIRIRLCLASGINIKRRVTVQTWCMEIFSQPEAYNMALTVPWYV